MKNVNEELDRLLAEYYAAIDIWQATGNVKKSLKKIDYIANQIRQLGIEK